MNKRFIANLVLCTFAVFVFGILHVEAAAKQEVQPNRLEIPIYTFASATFACFYR